MGSARLDFRRPTGLIGLIFMILGFIAYIVGIVLSMNWLHIAAMWTFIGASIGMVVALVFLLLNYSAVKKEQRYDGGYDDRGYRQDHRHGRGPQHYPEYGRGGPQHGGYQQGGYGQPPRHAHGRGPQDRQEYRQYADDGYDDEEEDHHVPAGHHGHDPQGHGSGGGRFDRGPQEWQEQGGGYDQGGFERGPPEHGPHHDHDHGPGRDRYQDDGPGPEGYPMDGQRAQGPEPVRGGVTPGRGGQQVPGHGGQSPGAGGHMGGPQGDRPQPYRPAGQAAECPECYFPMDQVRGSRDMYCQRCDRYYPGR